MVHEQKVERGVRQHEPQEPVARGHVGRDAGVRPPPGDDDGAFPGEEQRPFQFPQVAQTPGLVQVPDHEGKGFGHPALALSQGFHGLVMAGVGGQVKASEALDGHDPAVFQQARGPAGMASRSRRRSPSSSQTRGPQTGQAVGSA